MDDGPGASGVTPRNSGADELAAANQETPYANVCPKHPLDLRYLLIIPMYSASAIGRFDSQAHNSSAEGIQCGASLYKTVCPTHTLCSGTHSAWRRCFKIGS